MEALLYLDLTNKTAFDSVGGNRFRFPALSQGEEITISTRFLKSLEGQVSEVEREVVEMRASIGFVDARPLQGEWSFEIGTGGSYITAPLKHDATSADVASAINALSHPTLGTATVDLKDDSWIVSFANEDSAETPVELTPISTNSLFPSSFMRHRSFLADGYWHHDIRLIQAPVASTDQSKLVLPPPPTIETIVNGGSDTLTEWSEVQALKIPSNFRGTYQILRGFDRSEILDFTDSAAQIQRAITPLASPGGEFRVTNPTSGVAHIEFAGDMKGIDQDELTVEIFDAPSGDQTFTLSLNTQELNNILRGQSTVNMFLEIEADMEDEDDDQIVHTRKLLFEQVQIRRELHWEELSTAANIDWLRPPLPERYVPYDYSQVAVGQLHYSETVGDTVATSFVVDHNLDLSNLQVIVRENFDGGAQLVDGTDFSVIHTNTNSATVTALGGAPASGAWKITALGMEATSAFDPHTHPISDITGLQATLNSLGERVTELEDLSGGNPLPSDTASGDSVVANWKFPAVEEVYPSRESIEIPSEGLTTLDVSGIRMQGLLPAIHDTVLENLSSIVSGNTFPSASLHAGRVYVNDTGSLVIAPGGKGHRGAKLKPGAYIASDGRVWYEVVRYDGGTPLSVAATGVAANTVLDAVGHDLAESQIVRVAADFGNFTVDTNYYVVNALTDSFELEASIGGGAITAGDDGTLYVYDSTIETSYYPKAFERELFELHVNEKQLRLRRTFEANFAIELALLGSNSKAQWHVVIEKGEYQSATSPGAIGSNISEIVWDPVPWMSQRVILMPTATTHRFGVRVQRELISAVDTLTAKARIYGAQEGGLTAPDTANFAVRARLTRFDTEDNESDPRGLVGLRGLDLTGGAEDEEGSDGSITPDGTAIIK